MNSLQLTNKWKAVLSQLPETGMGYQLVRIFLKNGAVLRHHKVINASMLILPNGADVCEKEILRIELEN